MHTEWVDDKKATRLSDLSPGTVFEYDNELHMVVGSTPTSKNSLNIACVVLRTGYLRYLGATIVVEKWGRITGVSILMSNYA